MKVAIYLPAAVLCLLSAPLAAAEALKLDDETTRINYSLGYQIGGDFKRQGVEMERSATGVRHKLLRDEGFRKARVALEHKCSFSRHAGRYGTLNLPRQWHKGRHWGGSRPSCSRKF